MEKGPIVTGANQILLMLWLHIGDPREDASYLLNAFSLSCSARPISKLIQTLAQPVALA